ncbi:MAG: hypothetical protein IJN69_07050 [Oscillospiraceae bacterium]|nr:hypothetical protein [Oscillospiraceae bacterium]
MLKLSGCVITVISATLLFSRKVLENYYTYKFLDKAVQTIKQISFEGGNISYKQIFEKMDFDRTLFIRRAEENFYIAKKYTEEVKMFFDGLGRRDSDSEKQYILYGLNIIEHRKDECFEVYKESRKVYVMCGAAAGLLAVIFLI